MLVEREHRAIFHVFFCNERLGHLKYNQQFQATNELMQDVLMGCNPPSLNLHMKCLFREVNVKFVQNIEVGILEETVFIMFYF